MHTLNRTRKELDYVEVHVHTRKELHHDTSCNAIM